MTSIMDVIKVTFCYLAVGIIYILHFSFYRFFANKTFFLLLKCLLLPNSFVTYTVH